RSSPPSDPLAGRILRGDLAKEGARRLHLARFLRRELAEADPFDAPAAIGLARGDARGLRVGVRLADHGAPLVVAMHEEDAGLHEVLRDDESRHGFGADR